MTIGPFIDPLSDFGFKRLFASESNLDILIDLLNALLPEDKQVARVVLLRQQQIGMQDYDRHAVFDVACEGPDGEKFIVEVQRHMQAYYKDRCLFYSSFPIQQQAPRGDWNFQLAPVVIVSLLDFNIEHRQEDQATPADYYHFNELKDQHGIRFYDKYAQVYVELPRFHLGLADVTTQRDQWLYFLRHAAELQAPPPRLNNTMVQKAFDEALLAKLSPNERKIYAASLRNSRDLRNVIVTAVDEGIATGEVSGSYKKACEVAENLIAIEMTSEQISKATGLALHEVQAIRSQLDRQ